MAPDILTWPLPPGATGHSTLGNTVAKTTGAEVPVHANLCPCKTSTLRWQKELTQPLPGRCPSPPRRSIWAARMLAWVTVNAVFPSCPAPIPESDHPL